jgi:hypothetical protein
MESFHAEGRFVGCGQPAGTWPGGNNQRRARRPPDNELDSAERGTAARGQPVIRLRQRRRLGRARVTGREKRRDNGKISASGGILEGFAKEGDGARVVGMAGLRVQLPV